MIMQCINFQVQVHIMVHVVTLTLGIVLLVVVRLVDGVRIPHPNVFVNILTIPLRIYITFWKHHIRSVISLLMNANLYVATLREIAH